MPTVYGVCHVCRLLHHIFMALSLNVTQMAAAIAIASVVAIGQHCSVLSNLNEKIQNKHKDKHWINRFVISKQN